MTEDRIPSFRELPWLPERMEAAALKYKWAITHVPNLNEKIREYDDSTPWKPEKIKGVEDGKVRIRIYREPPKEIALILGDIVHNLRASLDYAVCGLVNIADNQASLLNIQFPFGELGKPLNSQARAPFRSIRDVGLPYIELARQAGGRHLSILREFSNQDKHRLVVPVLLRRLPIKFEIDHPNNTADIVVDVEREEQWLTPISDGSIIEMGNMLALRMGFQLDNDPTPYPLPTIHHMFAATHATLCCLFEGAKTLLAHQELNLTIQSDH